MRAFVGVTDLNWYEQIAAQRSPEVNFWLPSAGTGFGALTLGEFFVFKSHVSRSRPHLSNRLLGVGLFSGFARLRISEAWELFGTDNGVRSEAELRDRTARYRRQSFTALEDPEIGCVMLREVRMFSVRESLPAPSDFSLNVVRGKSYLLSELAPDHPVTLAVASYLSPTAHASTEADVRRILGPVHGEPALATPRLGQKAFKAMIAESYAHRCAVTGDKVRPVLEAAHVRPVSDGGEHRMDNGILLRSDMHRLFDRGYISVDSSYRLRVSPAIRTQFGNGDWLYSREYEPIALPIRRADRPNREFLDWHRSEVFLAG